MNNNFDSLARSNQYFMDSYSDGHNNDIVDDDGFLHVSRDGVRYSFDIGQDLSQKDYQKIRSGILSSLGLTN